MGQFFKKALKVLLSVLMTFGLIHTSGVTRTVKAAVGDEPAHSKSLIDNHDGTYTLALSVTGDSEKDPPHTNVIVILDVSGSMDALTGADDTYTPTNSTGTGLYGLVNGEYIALTRSGGAGNRTFWYQVNGQWVQYTGQRYTRQPGNQMRLDAAQDAINNLAQTLLSKNGATEEDGTVNPNDLFEMALITFSTNATIARTPTTSYAQFSAAVNNTNPDGGTNWEAALQQVSNVNFNDNDDTYVIFVSDGNPTFHVTDGNYGNYNSGYGVYGSGYEEETNITRCYTQALDDAKQVVNNNKAVYAIGAYGNVDRMETLVEESGAKAYYSAASTAALQEAFLEILEEIEMAGIADVGISDGTTSNVSTSAGVAHLLEVDPDSFKYYRSGGQYTGTETLNDGTTQVLLGTEWTDIQEASKAKVVNGTVQWDLKEEGVLENGVKYTVTFEVFPSQETLDLIADLKNGKIQYNGLDPAIRQYLVKNGDDYTLKTNTSASLSYDDTRDDAGTQTKPYTNPEPVSTSSSEMLAVSKEWVNTLDDRQMQPIELLVTRDGKEAYRVALNNDNHYKNTVHISIGILTDVVDDQGNHTVTVKTTGHHYSFSEEDAVSHNWGIDSPTVRPMWIGSQVVLLELCGPDEEYKVPAGIGSNSYYKEGDNVYYQLPDPVDPSKNNVYKVIEVADAEASLTATNYRRSHLYITKDVTGDAPEDTLYTYTFTATNPDESDVWFSIYDDPNYILNDDENTYVSGTGVKAETYEYKVGGTYNGKTITSVSSSGNSITFQLEGEEEARTYSYAKVEQNGDTYVGYTGYYYCPSGTQLTVKVQEGWSFGFTNIPTGFTYDLVESDDGDGKQGAYNFVSINYVDHHKETSGGAWVEDKNTTTTENHIAGTIEADNHEYLITVNNVYTLGEAKVDVKKVLDIADGLTGPGAITGMYTFTLTPNDGAPMQVLDATTGEYKTVTSLTVTNPDADGGTALFDKLYFTTAGTYTYTLTESNTTAGVPAGVTNDPSTTRTVTIKVTENADKTKTVTVSGDRTFTNTYEAQGTAKVGFSKTLVAEAGLTPPDITGAYTFTLASSSEGAPLPTPAALPNPDNGEGEKVTYGELVFTKPGTYVYTISESGSVNGVSIASGDTQQKMITFTVTDNGDGTLKVVATLGNGVTLDEELKAYIAAFTNEYKVNSTTAEVTVTKTLVIPAGLTGPASIKGAYTFTLVAVDGAPAPATTSVTNPDDNGGTASYGTITFTAPGTYTYEITESNTEEGKPKGVTNDSTKKKTVTFTVTDNGNGTLSVKPAIGNVEFKNTYNVTEITYELKAGKKLDVLSGDKAPDVSGKYDLTLTADGDAPLPEGAEGGKITIKNVDGNGTMKTFGTIKYTAPGEYKYTVTETGTVDGVTNGTATYNVTVKVTDNGDGTMSVEVTQGSQETLFTNTYSVEPVGIVLGASKTLEIGEGADPDKAPNVAGKYTITLKDAEGNVIGTFQNTDGAGTPTNFPAITYTAPGVYTYTVTEEGTVKGVTNGTTEYTVVVTVEDDGKGNLVATVTSGKQITEFVNTYEVGEAKIELGASKKLEAATGLNAPNVSEKYELTLTAQNGAPMPAGATDGKITVKNPDGNATAVMFGEIVYTAAGTYKYTVTESGNVPGVQNGTTSYEVVVTVTDNGDGTMTAEVTTGEAITKFVNTYKVSPTEITLGASKTLAAEEGLNAPDVSGKYTITLTDEEGNVIGTFTNADGEGTATNFPKIEYTKPGVYTYTVTEEGTVPGVKNGTDEYEVVVTVVDNGDGTLTASVTSGKQITNFVNTYEVKPTSIVLKASKTLEAEAGLNAPDVSGEYKLILKDEEGNEIEVKMNPDGKGTVISFTALEYTKPGTYTYTVTEDGDVPGVVNDTDNPKTLVVVVTDDGKGNLSAAIQDGGSDTAAFVNTYKVSEITYELKAGKKLEVENGNNAPDVSGKYDLTLTAIEGAPLPEGAADGKITIKNVDGNGTMATFGTIKYTAPGEYKYTVTETGDVDGVTNGTATYNVTVTVTDKGDGTMSVAVTEGKQETLFTNTYNVEPVAVKLGASKEVVVAEGLEGPDADDVKGAYTLTLKDAEGNVIEAVTNPDGEKTPAYYQELNFTKPGTYTYTVEETGSVDGVTNGTVMYTVTIVVTDKGDGTMSVVVTGHHREIDGAYIVDFVNTYELKQIEAELGASKLLEVAAGANNAPDVSKAYDLTLEAKDGAPMPEGAVDGKVTVKNPDGNATKVMFGKIIYTLPGVYKYTVTESGTVDGVENGTASYEVTVTVTDNHDGTMSVAIDPEDGITKFVNTYKVEPTEAPIEAAKSLVGRNLKAEEFEFSLIATDENFEPLDGAEAINVKNDADGKVDFGTFDYEAAGTYYYLITEIIPDEPLERVTYSEQQVKVTVTVTDDGHGKLVAEVAYEGGDGDKKNVFTNEYEPKPTETILSVEKTLNGRDLNAGEFEFTLTEVDADGNPVEGGVTLTATNDGAGLVTFDAIEYTSDDDLGTHYYKVVEVKGNLGGVTYDTKEVIFIVEVTYDADEGIYVATVTEPETIEFINTYVPKPVKAAPEATKELTGRDLNAGEFEFTLTEVDADGNPLEGGVTLTATNGADGSIKFDEIEFDKVGVHYYKITEVKGNLGGVTYDEEAIDVTITITDDLKGNLVADVKYGTKTTFINTYVPKPVDAVLKAAKELNGRVLEDKQFTFTLKDENGELIETVYNDADGNVVFSTLTFDKVGTYVYTINEMIKDAAGYTYDTKTITVTIVVKDDLKGNLYTEITYSDEEPFVNTYEADGEAQFEVYKELEGKELEEGEFTFELRDGDGNLLQTKTNDAEGKVVFDPIAYDEADAGEVFYYTITEVDGKKPGYTYDDLLIAVTVTVTDNGDGTLTCEVNYDDEDRIFHNVFELREVAVTKAWADDENRDGIRPESVVVKLFADGKDTGKAVVLNEDNNWYDIFKDLPKYDSKTGKLIEYTVEEEEVKGYTVKIEGDADNGYQVTNTHDSEKIEIPVEKVWKGDADYKDQVRPDMIQVMLLANGNPYEMIELSDANNWKHTFKNLFKYENGKEIEYTVSEKLEAAGYTKKITGSAEEGYTITNTFKPVWGDPPVGKEIIGDKPHKVETFTFKLKAVSTTAEGLSGKMPMPEAANGAQEMTMDIEGTGTKEFGKFDMVKVGKYEYEISEVKGDAEGFTYDKTIYKLTYEVTAGENNELVLTTYVDGKKVDKIDASYFTFTNEYTAPLIDVNVKKVWDDENNKDGIRPDHITVHLFADGKEVDKVEITKDMGWKYTFKDLPKYDGSKEIVYTITEDEIAKYTTKIEGDYKVGFTITNHHTVPTGVEDGSLVWMLTGALSYAGYFIVRRKKEEDEE